MIDPKEITIRDSDSEIIFSKTFTLHGNHFTVGKIGGFDFEFSFIEDKNTQSKPINVVPDNVANKILVTAVNFNDAGGVVTIRKLKVLEQTAGKYVWLSLQTKMLTQDIMSVTVTFYHD